MFVTGSYITVGDYEFPFCCEVEIVSDIDTLTDTCRITLPRLYADGDRLKSLDVKNIALGDDLILRRKDKVVVQFGYDGYLKTEFIGFVKNIKPGTPVTIECEDYMLLLKEKPLTATFGPGTTLASLLQAILPKEVKYKAIDVHIGEWRLNKISAARVLEELKSKMGLFFYFMLIDEGNGPEPILYAGWAFNVDNRVEEEFKFGHNIINGDNLVYRRKEDVRLKLKVINISGDNKRTEYELGDEDGETRTVHYYKLDAATMKLRAEKDLERFKYTGYQGSFETFGEPSVRPNDIANITGNVYHPSGKYLIKKVIKRCGVSTGMKQTIEPNQLINDSTAA
ncbi:MAG TPA: hypothetical protein PKC39_14515 [Ferruginibacter sp.]|nr:hypothetical protein [Ferruginibacter sp.]HMP22169.1 hypothetical protein [Ferruginibacter sp.]